MRLGLLRHLALPGLAALLAATTAAAPQARAQVASPAASLPTACLNLPVTFGGGNASRLTSGVNSGQYQLTPNSASQLGAVWGTMRANLAQPIDYQAWIYLGSSASPYGGGDGMTFTFQNSSATAIGRSGRGIGAGHGYSTSLLNGLSPALTIEFDTYANGDDGWNDPPNADHTSVYYNGDGRHSGADLNGVHSYASTLKDDRYHLMRTTWDPSTNNLRVYLDNILIQNITSDLRGVLGNTPYWGYTASTGGATNSHRVCNLGTPYYPTGNGTNADVASADYGDAPASYGQAWHFRTTAGAGVNLGAAPTADVGPRTHATASLDANDDSFYMFPNPVWSGGTIPIYVSGGGYLSIWVDWNRNGVFDSGEKVVSDLRDNATGDLNAASGLMEVYIPPNLAMSAGQSFIRMRWSTQPGLGPTGAAWDGEVEDHPVILRAPTTHNCPSSFGDAGLATSGSGRYRPDITWLGWDCGGVAQFVTGDTVVKTWNLFNRYELRGTLSGLVNALNPAAVNGPYNSLRHLYSGPVQAGLVSTYNAGAGAPNIPFRLNFELLDLYGTPLPYSLTTIAADAEDMFGPTESLTVGANLAADPWRIIEILGRINARFFNGERSVFLNNDPYLEPSTAVLAAPRADEIDVIVDPGGAGAVAFGVFTGADMGDAPDSYGMPGHIQPIQFADAVQPTTLTRLGYTEVASRDDAVTLKMGAGLDTEIEPHSSPDASGDQHDDGLLGSSVFFAAGESEFSVAVTGYGYLNAWIDWDQSGQFDHPTELVALNVTDGGAEDLDPTAGVIRLRVLAPPMAAAGPNFLRLRWSGESDIDPTQWVIGGEVEDHQIEILAPPMIRGTIFEDKNYGGGAGRAMASAPGATPIPGVLVEIYDATGFLAGSTLTDALGAYEFSVPPGTYYVRPLAASVASTRGAPGSGALGVQTFRRETDPGDPYALRAVTDEIGGRRPDLPDPVSPNDGSSILQPGSWIFSGGPLHGETAQSVSLVQRYGGDVTDVDFGYNFSSIVNTNDAGQGSLRQVILNANLLERASLDQAANSLFDPPPGTETTIFQIPASDPRWTSQGAEITLSTDMPALDVRDFRLNAYTQPGAQPGPFGSRVTRVILNSASGGASLLVLGANASRTVVAGFAFEGGVAVRGLGSAENAHIKGNLFGSRDGSAASVPTRLLLQNGNAWTIGVLPDGLPAASADGMTDAMEGNLFAAHEGQTLRLENFGGGTTLIAGNRFNLAANGVSALNGVGAQSDNALVALHGVRDVRIGGYDLPERNLFAGPARTALLFDQSGARSAAAEVYNNDFGFDAFGVERPALRPTDGLSIIGEGAQSILLGSGSDDVANAFSVVSAALRVANPAASGQIDRNFFGVDRSETPFATRHAAQGALRFEGPAAGYYVQRNLIARGGGHGVVLASLGGASAQSVFLRRNSFFGNLGLAIDLGDDFVTLDDAHDADAGPNGSLNFPLLRNAVLNGDDVILSGCAPAGSTIEIYEHDDSAASPSGDGSTLTNIFGTTQSYGEGWRLVTWLSPGTAACAAWSDVDGNQAEGMMAFSATLNLNVFGLSPDSRLTMTASLNSERTSEFSPAYPFTIATDLTLTKTAATPNSPGPLMGFPVDFHVRLTNQMGEAHQVVVRDLLPAGHIFGGAFATEGLYESTTGLWTLDGVTAATDASLVIRSYPAASGPWTNVAEVMSSTDAGGAAVPDLHSTAGNGDPGEKDYAEAEATPMRGTAPPVGAAVCPLGEIGVDWASTSWAAGASSGVLRFGELEGFFTVVDHLPPAVSQIGVGAVGPGGAAALALRGGGRSTLEISFSAPVEGLRMDLRGLSGDSRNLEYVGVVGGWAGATLLPRISGGSSVSVSGGDAVGVLASSPTGEEGRVIVGFDGRVQSLQIGLANLAEDMTSAPPWEMALNALTACRPQQDVAFQLSPDHEAEVPAGQLAIYAHRLQIGQGLDGGAVSFEAASERGLTWALYRDDGDGVHGPGDALWDWSASAMLPSGHHAFWLVTKIPEETAGGWSDLTRLTARIVRGGLSGSASVADLTRVGGDGSGAIFARKLQAVDADCNGVPDAGEASFTAVELSIQSGHCVVYRILFENRGVTPVGRVRIQDHTPSWMVYLGGSAQVWTRPAGLTIQPPDAPADAAEGPVSFPFGGSLQPGEGGEVRFGARLPPLPQIGGGGSGGVRPN